MKIKPEFIFVLIILFLSNLAISQKRDIRFENFNISAGLSHSTVHCIAQDDKGFLWIGTEDGLNMFDGYSFVSFKKNLQNPFSISDNFISSLYLDKKQNLWIGTNNKGLNLFNRITARFKSYSTFYFHGKTMNLRMINAITEDSKGHLWLGTFSGLFEFDPISEKIISQYHPTGYTSGISDDEIRCMYMEKNDILWIGTNSGGLNRFDIRTKTFRCFQYNPNNKTSLSNNSVSAIMRDKSGTFWVGTSWGLNSLDEKNNKFEHYYNDLKNPKSISANSIYSIYEDHLNNLWIGTLNGLDQYDKEKECFYNWIFVQSKNPSFFDNQIFSLFEDKFGQFWVGTATKGICKFNNQLKKFKNLPLNDLYSNGFSNENIIREIYQDDGSQIWLGTLNDGLYVYNQKNGQISSFKHNQYDPQSLSDNRVNTIYKDSKANIWIGTWDGGLNRAIPQNGNYRFEHFFHNTTNPLSIADNVIKEIIEDTWKRIWLGTENGLDLFDPLQKKAIHFVHQQNNKNSLVNNSIQTGCIIFDMQNNMWVGTWGGLSKVIFSEKSRMPEKFLNYQQNDTSAFSISENRVIALHLSKNNILYAGTFGGGLNKIILNEKSEIIDIKHFTEKNGLPNNVVYAILEDEKGFLWLSTNNGLSKFNPHTEKFENYDENDGLQSNQFFWGAACKLKSGELAFGSINGLNIFYPDEILEDKIAPEIVITDFRIFDQKPDISEGSKLNKSIIYADTIFLDYKDNVISFEFSALQFADPVKNKYAYKLEGFNKNWISTDSKKRFAVFTNLEPNEYTFMVKGSNADGIWNKDYKSIKIIVAPPIWQTWWFRLLVCLFIAFSLFGLYRYRIATLRRQKKRLEKTVKEKTREILHQNEELKSVNEKIAVTNEELEHQREELEVTLQSLKDAQSQLIQSEKMASLGILSAGVAHEINNPLNFIQGGIVALETYFKENLQNHINDVNPMINGIQVGVRRAAAIVTSLNHYSRQDNEKKTECNIHEIIENCLIMLNNQLKNRIEISKNYTDEKLLLLGNESKLHQALLNILSNAVQSIENEGTIKISTLIENDVIKIAIEDSGSGINPQDLPKIFDPFFTTKDPGKGTGLGLSITYNIIKEHNGTIEVESETAKGTQFTISFPVLIVDLL